MKTFEEIYEREMKETAMDIEHLKEHNRQEEDLRIALYTADIYRMGYCFALRNLFPHEQCDKLLRDERALMKELTGYKFPIIM